MDLLLRDDEVMSRLNPDDLAAAFKVDNFLKQVDFIFGRVFGGKP